jgi:putative hemolysin
VRELVVGELEFLQSQCIDGVGGKPSSTCGSRTDKEFTFQVAIFIFFNFPYCMRVPRGGFCKKASGYQPATELAPGAFFTVTDSIASLPSRAGKAVRRDPLRWRSLVSGLKPDVKGLLHWTHETCASSLAGMMIVVAAVSGCAQSVSVNFGNPRKPTAKSRAGAAREGAEADRNTCVLPDGSAFEEWVQHARQPPAK